MRLNRPHFDFRASMPSAISAVLWCAAALSAGYWFWQWPQDAVLPQTVLGSENRPINEGDTLQRMTRVLGGVPSQGPVRADDSRMQLLGVIADAHGQGRALIALDGQPPQAYRVGQAVGEGLVLKSLSSRAAQLGAAMNAPALFELQLPALSTP